MTRLLTVLSLVFLISCSGNDNKRNANLDDYSAPGNEGEKTDFREPSCSFRDTLHNGKCWYFIHIRKEGIYVAQLNSEAKEWIYKEGITGNKKPFMINFKQEDSSTTWKRGDVNIGCDWAPGLGVFNAALSEHRCGRKVDSSNEYRINNSDGSVIFYFEKESEFIKPSERRLIAIKFEPK